MPLEILDAHVETSDGKEIVHGVTLRLEKPGIYLVMGPNGAGKSSLANAVMGHEAYRFKGRVLLDGEDVTSLPTHEKARKGLTLATQMPPEIEGVRVAEVLIRIIKRFRGVSEAGEASRVAKELLELVGLPPSIMNRYFMVGMSGGERKRLELARVLAQRPRAAILDEPDSGVDIESMPLIARAIERLVNEGAVVMLITHQPKLLEYFANHTPSRVYVLYGGRLVAEGGPELVKTIVERGYTWIASGAGR